MNIAMQSLDTESSIPHALHNLSPEVAALNFARLKHKHTSTAEAVMTEQDWDLAEREYRRFLTLKQRYPAMALAPSKLIDKVWHAHILDTRAYREDCNNLFGHFMDHYPYFGIYGKEDLAMLEKTFKETVVLYELHFGPYPMATTQENNQAHLATIASRCGDDHACHAPSECACRVPGACK